jgi:hypothetical protein
VKFYIFGYYKLIHDSLLPPTAVAPPAATTVVLTSSGPSIGPVSSVAAFAPLIERDPAEITRQIRVAPPSPTIEFTQWVGYFQVFSRAGQRSERNRLRRLQAALETVCEEEDDKEDEEED